MQYVLTMRFRESDGIERRRGTWGRPLQSHAVPTLDFRHSDPHATFRAGQQPYGHSFQLHGQLH